MNKIILADGEVLFRTGMAKVLAMEDDLRIIAQCPNRARFDHALATFGGAVCLVASSFVVDITRFAVKVRSAKSRVVVIVENNEHPQRFIDAGLHGVIFRNISSEALITCVRAVIGGGVFVQRPEARSGEPREHDADELRHDPKTTVHRRIVAALREWVESHPTPDLPALSLAGFGEYSPRQLYNAVGEKNEIGRFFETMIRNGERLHPEGLDGVLRSFLPEGVVHRSDTSETVIAMEPYAPLH